jgi:hypothetical protein
VSTLVKRTDAEIERVINEASEYEEEGRSRWRGMSYESGVLAALRWLFGEVDENPMDDE